MNSLIDILGHDYIVINRMAEAIYGETGNAINQRLRSRIKRRHHFTVEDYKASRRELLAFSRQLDRIADKMEKLQAGDKKKIDWLKQMHHPILNHKNLIAEVATGFQSGYYSLYDGLRNKKALPKGVIPAMVKEYRQFAEQIRAALESAKEEKKTYTFSQGRGGASHRGEEE